MKKYVSVLSLVFIALIAANSFAEDKAEEKKKAKEGKKGKTNQVAQMALKQLAKAELTDDQKSKIEKLGKEYAKTIQEARKSGSLTKEQREKMAAARKAAQAEGKKGAELKKAVQEAAGLSDEQKAAMAKVAELEKEFMGKVKEMLTDEQKAKIGKGGKPDAKKKKKKEEEKKEAAAAE